MQFFNLGASELMLIMLFAILAVGPKETLKLVNQAREIVSSLQAAVGELSSEMSRAASEAMDPIDELGKKS